MQNFNEFLFAARPQIAFHLPPENTTPAPKRNIHSFQWGSAKHLSSFKMRVNWVNLKLFALDKKAKSGNLSKQWREG